MYVRDTKGNRHVCSICGRKRLKEYMFKTGYRTNYALPVWVCRERSDKCLDKSLERDYYK